MKACEMMSAAAGFIVDFGNVVGDRNFETTANPMTISRQGSHRKLLEEFAVIGLAHRGHVMQSKRRWHICVPTRSSPTITVNVRVQPTASSTVNLTSGALSLPCTPL